MPSFKYTLPAFRFRDATDTSALTLADYDFLARWGAVVQPYRPIFDSDIAKAHQNHSKSIFLRRTQIKPIFERIKEDTASLKLVVGANERARERAQLDDLRAQWCDYLAEYICGSDVFIFVNGVSDDTYDEGALSMEEVTPLRLEKARDALQEMLRISQPSSQLGDWAGRKIYIEDDFVLHWDN
ncbi:hypothetical protein EST38_g5920 [Candolleomyces aberdarensis]|uniref:Uncharacterized protein n=1 Tax=Candolleomyces aberdarensis TaxID=2316362 RepID=A0A4Q2DL62_9AGAR|nr:hypothetical protein EST38_g5920 [Candolleomyces aberdarensis]